MSSQFPANYQNTYNRGKNYTRLLMFPQKGATAAEMNELQSMLTDKTAKLSEILLKEGDIVSGGSPAVNSGTGLVSVPAGAIYVNKDIREFAEQSFTIPTDRVVELGCFLKQEVITSAQDPDLEDPSGEIQAGVIYQTSGEETSQRYKETVTWGYKDDQDNIGPVGITGTFYKSFTVENGVLILNGEAPILDSVNRVVANYDRSINREGYIVNGYNIDFDVEDDNLYIYSVAAGEARVNGIPVRRKSNDRVEYTIDPDTQSVTSDPFTITVGTLTYTATLTKQSADSIEDLGRPDVTAITNVTDGTTTYTQGVDYQLTGNSIDWSLGGTEPADSEEYSVTFEFTGAQVEVDKGPIDAITDIVVPLEISENVDRGAVADTSDTLDNSPVVTVLSVTQNSGSTVYTEGVDFTVDGSQINWSLGGAEPAPLSTYQVVYRYNRSITEDAGSVNNRTFTITNQGVNGDLASGVVVNVDYNFRLPRIDIIQLTEEGLLERKKGIPLEFNPNLPQVDSNAIALASIQYDWINDPLVQNIGNRAISQKELDKRKQNEQYVFDSLAELKLEVEAIKDGSTSLGGFVDTFETDVKQDLGKTNDCRLVDRTLTHEIVVNYDKLDNTNNETFHSLPYNNEVIASQPSSSGAIKINPFATFTPPKPIIADIRLDPRVSEFIEETISNVVNTKADAWVPRVSPPRIVNNPGIVTAPNAPRIFPRPEPAPPAERMEFSETKALVLNAKGKKRLNAQGKRQLVRLQTKINSGETVTKATIGKHVIDLTTGDVLRRKK